jgi:hypothetical protein
VGNLFGDESDGDEVIVYSSAEDFLGLEECPRDLVQSRDVILVVLDRVEWHGKREVGQVCVDAATAAGSYERHLKLFEFIVVDALLQLAEKEVVGDPVLFREAGRIDGPNAGQVGKIALVARRGRGE